MRMSNRQAVAFVLFAVVAISSTVIAWVAVSAASADQRSRAEMLLLSELTARRDSVQFYLETIEKDLLIIAATRIIEQGMAEFSDAIQHLGANAGDTLRQLYIANNPNPVGLKHALLRANTDARYNDIHERYHRWFSEFSAAKDFYDLFLVSANGDIVYTVYKESDFGTNLLVGEYKDTQLGSTFQRISDDPRPGAMFFTDFSRYAPSNGLAAAFVGTPLIFDNQFHGTLIVQLKSERFDELMNYSRLMGESGETYLVGEDKLMRSRSRFSEQSSVLETAVDTPSVTAALANTSGVQTIENYRGVEVLSAYAPLSWQGVTWAVLAEIDQTEIDAPSRALVWQLGLIACCCALAACVLGFFLADVKRPS